MAHYDYVPTEINGSSLTGGNLTARFRVGRPGPFDTRPIRPVEVAVPGAGTRDVRGQPVATTWEMWVVLGTVDETDIDAFYKIFDEEAGLVVLKATDGAASPKTWRINCRVIGISRHQRSDRLFIVRLWVPDPVWEEDTLTSTTEAMSGDQNTHTETNNGNRKARATYIITPNSVKVNGIDDYKLSLRGFIVNRMPEYWNDLPIQIFDDGGEADVIDHAAMVTVAGQALIDDAGDISDTDTEITFDTETGGGLFTPPDPIGAAGTDRLIAVVNVMIEARDKTGSLLWRDGLEDFFSSLSPPTWSLFDPKVVYDHYQNRFLVVVLEAVDAETNPNAGNTSRILLAVSKDATPDSATTADWYYTDINSEESIGPPTRDYWADYPGFEVDEEAVYITANMFAHPPFSTYGGVRLWIVDKGVSAGFYFNGSAPTVTKHNPYAGGGSAVTTMPAQVYGTGGAGVGIGTYLVSHSGLYFIATGNEIVQVVRINDPLGTTTFTQAYVDIGDIDDVAAPLPDAPQLGSATDIEVNDRRALDAVWRNNRLWLTTTILPKSGADAGETTAHWFRLNTSVWPPTLNDQGDIGGEDIDAAGDVTTFFPSLAVNNNGDAKFGFSASSAAIYAGAYATAHLAGGAAGSLQPSETVRVGVAYYVRTFGGPRNRWGDYTGTALDPLDDNVVWLFNQYAMARGSASGGEDGRWGTAWARNLFNGDEMDVQGKGNSIADGDVTPSTTDHPAFGSTDISSGTVDHTFTIENTGTLDLNLTGTPKVAISGADAGDFSVTAQPTSPVTSGGGTTTFTVRFDPSAIGLRQATLSIANDDSDENPYDFAIQGRGITWDSHTDPARADPPEDTFASPNTTVYMKGTGFASDTYTVSYYDATAAGGGSKVYTESGISLDGNGFLNSQITLTSYPSSIAGTWHALVQPTGATAFPSTYDAAVAAPDTYDLIANDSFTVEQSAIPEFPTVLAAMVALALAAGVYLWMRRKAVPVRA